MKPLTKLAVVVAIQIAILLCVVGFKQYTLWTSETVVLRVAPIDLRDLLQGEDVSYEISEIDLREIGGDDELWDPTVYVELREGDDGYWDAVAIHNGHEPAFDGTVLIKGKLQAEYYPVTRNVVQVTYGIEEIFVPEDSSAGLPSGTDHTVAVEVKVDRFGNAVPRRFFVDGEPYDLERR